MSKIIFKKAIDEKNPYDNTEVTVEFNGTSLNEAIDAFEDFLLAIGYRFNGKLEIVETDDSLEV